MDWAHPEILGAIVGFGLGAVGASVVWMVDKTATPKSNGNGKVSHEMFEAFRAENAQAHTEIHEKINKANETAIVTSEAVSWIKRALERRSN